MSEDPKAGPGPGPSSDPSPGPASDPGPGAGAAPHPERAQKPVPRLTPDNRPFWDGCRAHKIMLPACQHCDRPHWPPGPVCPFCFSDELSWVQASGRGTVSSWVVVHKAWLPAFEADLPYNAVQVELEEGVRLTGNVVGISNQALRVGMAVEAVFDDVTPEVTLPRFRPRSS